MFSTETLITTTDSEIMRELHVPKAWSAYCGNFTLEDLFTTDSVYIAACHASSGFMDKKDTWCFMQSAWTNSYKLCQQVLGGTFRPKYFKERSILERGKPRVIKPPYFECKVVQKVICDYLIRPLFEPRMIDTSYASIKGRGTHRMYKEILEELNRHLNDAGGINIVMGDYCGYFASIPVGKLMYEVFAPLIKDRRVVELIHMFSPDEFGLSLGNELSQVPASFYPTPFDRHVKEDMKLPYFRFMDDSLAIIPKEMTDAYIADYKAYTDRLDLKTADKKIRIVSVGQGFRFCKELFLWDSQKKCYYTRPNPKAETIEKRKLKAMGEKLREGEINEHDITKQFRSVMGGMEKQSNNWKSRQRLWDTYHKTIGKQSPEREKIW